MATIAFPLLRDKLIGTSDVYCDNGVVGVQYEDSTCCEAQCTACGGADCYKHPGGEVLKSILSDISLYPYTVLPAPASLVHNRQFLTKKLLVCQGAQPGSNTLMRITKPLLIVRTRPDELNPPSLPFSQDACCVGIITGSGVTCSTTKKAPCIIDGRLCRPYVD